MRSCRRYQSRGTLAALRAACVADPMSGRLRLTNTESAGRCAVGAGLPLPPSPPLLDCLLFVLCGLCVIAAALRTTALKCLRVRCMGGLSAGQPGMRADMPVVYQRYVMDSGMT